ncbi:hypothetical protein J6590_077598 [Homalodisca vitripennis]|nr:hypothetical protein J6590_077598 [Homalodisca vitripennis]
MPQQIVAPDNVKPKSLSLAIKPVQPKRKITFTFPFNKSCHEAELLLPRNGRRLGEVTGGGDNPARTVHILTLLSRAELPQPGTAAHVSLGTAQLSSRYILLPRRNVLYSYPFSLVVCNRKCSYQ